MLRQVATAYTLKKSNVFQIQAYENAAAAIEHSTSEVRDLWEEKRLDQLPAIGDILKARLEELFTTGKVKHWEEVKKGIPEEVFEFIDIPGVGPKIALELSKLGASDKNDLKKKLESGLLVGRGFSQKIAAKILASLVRSKTESSRMLLPYAFAQTERVLEYLQKNPDVKRADALGSLRRMVATVGDLDFAVSSSRPSEIVEYLVNMPGISRVEDKGERKVTLINNLGLRLDFMIAEPEAYGALLQHFTGSKAHNIHLRIIAERKGLSLSEYGIKNVKTGQVHRPVSEEEFYRLLDMEMPPPEIREDTGEIEAALEHSLPELVQAGDIKGDLHVHDNFPIEPSHDLGQSSVGDIIREARKLGYQYVGISDHSPSSGNHTAGQITELIRKHIRYIDKYKYSHKSIRVLKLIEVDIQPDGELSMPDEALKLLDFAIASIHSLHSQPKGEITKRILKALENPRVKVLGHPTGRLINKRDSYDADWEAIFKAAASRRIALEINSFPDRLDLPDNLVRLAKSFGVKFVIDTDSHEASQMSNIRFGVAVARRGWATSEDILNCWEWDKFAAWFGVLR